MTSVAKEVTDWTAARQVELARREAPVDTGHLQANIRVVKVNQYRTDARSDADYSAYVNYGTRRQSPNPFWDRALEQVRREVAGEAAKIMRRKVR